VIVTQSTWNFDPKSNDPDMFRSTGAPQAKSKNFKKYERRKRRFSPKKEKAKMIFIT